MSRRSTAPRGELAPRGETAPRRRRAAAAGLAAVTTVGGLTVLPGATTAAADPVAPPSEPSAGAPSPTGTAAADRQAAERRANRAGRASALVAPTRVRPVQDYRLSARYGQRGSRWSSGRHTGLDFAAPAGRPVQAAQAGRVVAAGWHGPYGKSVVIRHGNGVATRYAHLSRITVGRGERVDAGQRIGRIGSTGNSTGPHLHFEVLRDGRHRDPHDWLRRR